MSSAPTTGTRFLAVGAGGLGGALARAALSQTFPPSEFPAGLLLTQTLGCLLAGLLTPWLLRRGPLWSLTVLTGGLASFTTFGLFTGEVLALAPHHLLSAALYLASGTVLGVGAAVVGLQVSMGEITSLSVLAVPHRRGPAVHEASVGPTSTGPIDGGTEHGDGPVRHHRGWRS
ncbi:FluC/FEX family fluoride channel [Arsenicicoccus dermatophilus]|uniref:FluC/FEX family fluoride channel n=1 Tax=Arsenicicoccus dermatophilus TaxID=1076331 RepID=UPI0039175E6C